MIVIPTQLILLGTLVFFASIIYYTYQLMVIHEYEEQEEI